MRLALAGAVAVVAAMGLSVDVASASVTVVPTRTDDPSGAGNCPSDCSLRQAVNYVQANGGGTVDLTNAPVPVLYTLTSGTLTVSPMSGESVAIVGPNPRLVKLSDKGAAGGVINVTGQTVSISGVTIADGTSSGNGGGILNGGTLTLNNVEVIDNGASGNPAAGGGIYNNGPTLTISNSTITGNAVTAGIGSTAFGGGIANNTGGTLNVTNSTITGNSVTAGALGTATGGGLWQAGGASTAMALANVTLNANSASAGLGGTASGGNLGFSGPVTIANTIISGGTPSNCGATATSLGYNLEDDKTAQCGFTGTGDQGNVDPQLQPLGPSPTGTNFTDVETVAVTSPVIDRGNPTGCNNALGVALATDQEANPRGTPCDIGAYETILPPKLVTGPAVTGTPQTGQLLTCSGATFSGITPITLSYAWLRNGTAIAGATAPTYTPVAPDVGQGVACSVTATNVDGTFSATSAAVSVALPPLPPFDGVTLLKTRFTLNNSQVILPVQCSKVAIFGCGGIVKITVAGSGSSAAAAAKAKKKKKHHKPAVPHPTTLGTATFKFSTAQVGTIPVLISHDAKLEIASRPHGRQAVTIAILAYDGLARQKITTYSGEITAPAGTVKKHKKKRTRHKR